MVVRTALQLARRCFRGARTVLTDQRGYTLVELIGAMTIFALISVATVGALVSVSQSSSKTTAERRVQQDARYNTEEVARQIRSSSVDYPFYATTAPECALGSAPNATRALALIFTETDGTTRRLVFYADGGSLYRYEDDNGNPTPPSCNDVRTASLTNATGPRRTKLNADDVTVSALTFYISPNRSPYDTASCGGDVTCEAAKDTHPRVTLSMTVQTVAGGFGTSRQARSGAVTFSTTVSSRAYPVEQLLGQPGS